MERRIALQDHGGPQLWTREKAREIRATFEPILAESEPGDALVIDAEGIEVFDYSFANELFGRTIIDVPRDFPGRFVLIVEHLGRYARENLEKALEGMGLAMVERKGKAISLIGQIHPIDKLTFSAIKRAKGPITAAELALKLDVNLNAMNERLSKLVGMGLVWREEGASAAGRKQYEYQTLT